MPASWGQSWITLGLGLLLGLAACAPLATPAPAITAAPASTRPAMPTLPPAVAASPTPAPSLTPAPTASATPEPHALNVVELHLWDAATGWGLAAEAPAADARQLLITADGGQTWRDRTPPDPLAARAGYALSAFFLDSAHGWAAYFDTAYSGVPESLTVWRTPDGGASWSAGAAPVPAAGGDWGELQFVSPTQGWLTLLSPGMAVHGIVLYGTQDGGLNWEPLGSPVTSSAGDMQEDACTKSRPVFVNATDGWLTGACDNSAYLFFKRTTDGGRTWSAAHLDAPADAPGLLAGQCWGTTISTPVFFTPAQGAFTLACEAVTSLNPPAPAQWVYVTADGGAHWQARRLPAPYGRVAWAGPAQGWYSGRDTFNFKTAQQLYQTTDGGLTWNTLAAVAWQGEPVFVDGAHGWTAARGPHGQSVLRTTDGGLTWHALNPRLIP